MEDDGMSAQELTLLGWCLCGCGLISLIASRIALHFWHKKLKI